MNYVNRPEATKFVVAAAGALADAIVSEHGYAPAPSPEVANWLEWGVRLAIDVAAQDAEDSAIISALVYFGHASPTAVMELSEDNLLERATESVRLRQEVANRARAMCM